MTDPTVVGDIVAPPGSALADLDLVELAKLANAEGAMVERATEAAAAALSAGLIHAIQAGAVLAEARDRPEMRGNWQRWLAANWNFSYASAQKWIRYHEYRHRLYAAGRPLDARTAHVYLAGLPSARDGGNGITESQRAEIKRLHGEGATFQEIADLVGVSWVTARCTVDPVYAKTVRRRGIEEGRRRRAARKALNAQKERDERAAKAKAGTENQQAIWNAIRDASNRVAREAPRLHEIEKLLLKAEEQILEAIDRSEHGR